MNHNMPAYVRDHETTPRIKNRITRLLFAGIALCGVFGGMQCVDADGFLPDQMIVSTVPPNGDVNPYGVAFVPQGFPNGGPLQAGDILVSNFNNNMNLQGTGTTIVRVSASGTVSPFFAGPPHPAGSSGLGLSTALAVLSQGFVIVGNVPSTDGTAATVTPGSLLVISKTGRLVSTITGPNINGPWDMTVLDQGSQAVAFISNVLAGTVVRLNLNVAPNGVTVANQTVIASGYAHRGDPTAFVVGPTGLVYDQNQDVLFVASTEDNAVFAVQGAATRTGSGGKGTLIYADAVHLHGPLAMAEASNGHLLVSNSDVINSDPNQPSEIVEFTKQGQFIKQLSVDPAQGGSFGLAVSVNAATSFFAAVNDNTATLTVWRIPRSP
ncbi:MAG TPA: hypothetical protein VM717_03995 [Chthoniobacterales bacterium]|nr:hypothetical protein [Chthoniobacterales bacterium]